MWGRLFGLAAALALGGCAPRALPSPADTLAAWSAAAARNDPHAAWQLLSPAARAGQTEADFTATWRENAGERARQAAALRTAAAEHHVWERARVSAGGRVAALAREPAGWRLEEPRRTPAGAATPEEAIRRLEQALETHDLDLFLQLLADPLRSTLERELGERIERLRAAFGRPVAQEGERATLRLDARYHIDLVRENGEWKIADLN